MILLLGSSLLFIPTKGDCSNRFCLPKNPVAWSVEFLLEITSCFPPNTFGILLVSEGRLKKLVLVSDGGLKKLEVPIQGGRVSSEWFFDAVGEIMNGFASLVEISGH